MLKKITRKRFFLIATQNKENKSRIKSHFIKNIFTNLVLVTSECQAKPIMYKTVSDFVFRSELEWEVKYLSNDLFTIVHFGLYIYWVGTFCIFH